MIINFLLGLILFCLLLLRVRRSKVDYASYLLALSGSMASILILIIGGNFIFFLCDNFCFKLILFKILILDLILDLFLLRYYRPCCLNLTLISLLNLKISLSRCCIFIKNCGRVLCCRHYLS